MRRAGLIGLLLCAAACAVAETQSQPPATARLVNAAFDDNGGLTGWARRGERYGQASLVSQPVVSSPGALELVAKGPGSSGDESFMIYQVLEPSRYRGKRVRFGAQVYTDGGAVNLTLYTPERFANDFFQDLHSRRYVAREAAVDVPENASFLSFGIQVFGKAGARAYVDNVFLRVEGDEASTSTSGPRTASVPDDRAEILIDAARPDRTISPLVFGMHLEWAAGGNGLVDERTGEIRRDVLDALTPLRIPLFRFPGGIHADYYDWSSGARPRASRPEIVNIFTGQPEPQSFATPELNALRAATGADAIITANAGTGTPAQAVAWARHLQQAGAPARFWEIGNEIYLADPDRDQPNGRRIARGPEQYAADVARYRDGIRAVQPGAQVGVIAHVDSGAFPFAPAARRDWSSRMLEALRSPVDFVAVHDAYAPVIIGDGVNLEDEATRARVYRALYAAPRQTADDLRAISDLLDRHDGTTRGVPLAVTELGALFGYSNKRDVHAIYVDQSRTMAAAVYMASLLDTLLGTPRVLLACYTNPIHRWYGSLLTDTERGLIRTPTYYVYELYRTRFEPQLVWSSVRGPTFDSTTVGVVKAQADVPVILARASVSADQSRLSAMVVNRSLDRTMSIRLGIAGFVPGRADCRILSGFANAINGPGLTGTTRHDQKIVPQVVTCTAGTDMTVAMPPSSVLSLRVQRRQGTR